MLTEKWYASGGSLSQTQTWTYDAAGKTITAQDPDGTYTLTYDAASRVTNVKEPFSLVLTMGYDAAGNRTSVQDSKGGYTTVTFDALNRQTSEQTAGSGITGMRFDYAYTARGEVTQRVTYVYDALGNRIERDYWNGSTTTTERCGMDGWDPAKPPPVGNETFDAWVDLDGSNNLTMRRTFGTEFDELIARQTSGGTVLWYLADYQQSVRLLVDNSGSVVGTLAYSAFGQVSTNSGTTDRYRSTGREDDAAMGLRFNRGRFYDVDSGKWMSPDPKGFAAGDVDLYRYVGNSPTNAIDPSGYQQPKGNKGGLLC